MYLQGYEDVDSFFNAHGRYESYHKLFVLFVGHRDKSPGFTCSGSEAIALVLDRILGSYIKGREDSWCVVVFDIWSEEQPEAEKFPQKGSKSPYGARAHMKSALESEGLSRVGSLFSDFKNTLLCESVSHVSREKGEINFFHIQEQLVNLWINLYSILGKVVH